MLPADLDLRNATYRLVVELGRVPSADDVAAATGEPVDDVRMAWQRLHAAHALVLDTAGQEIRMANPFSAVPTPYRVQAAGRWWFANCAWDAFGICAALRVDGRIETACADCGQRLDVAVRDGSPDDRSLLFHCLVPARQWWDDIVFTQSGMNLFRSEEHVRRWLGDRPAGAMMPVTTLRALARAWWGDRLAADWHPHTRDENQAILDRLGLLGDFWRLP